jgi:hypothetical protein
VLIPLVASHKAKLLPFSEKPYIDMQWDLSFTGLRLDFLFGDRDGYGYRVNDCGAYPYPINSHPATPLFAMASQKLSLHMDMMSDSALVLDVITTGFVLDDTRPKTRTVFPV